MSNEFIEIDYTGRADGIIFDTTRKSDAPKGSKGPFGPSVVKLGSGQLLTGLDKFLSGKPAGNYSITLAAEEAFGKKDTKLLRLVPIKAFGKEAQKLEPGVPVTIGETRGIVKSVGGGRVVVDFNHPLASKEVSYDITIHGVVTDNKKKVSSVVKSMLGVPLPITEEEGAIVVGVPKGFPAEELIQQIEKHSGVAVKHKEIELKHDHSHEHGAQHHHEHSDHNHHH